MPPDILTIIMRWLHLSSMATLLGGMLYWRLVLAPASEALSPETRQALGDKAASIFSPMVFASIAGLLVSGVYKYLTSPGHQPTYHMIFGIKMLLALHVFAVAILIARPGNARRTRMLTGTVISGLVIVFLSAWLRHIF
jgi:putative copper export protein